MALTLYPTFTPSGFKTFACPPTVPSDPTGAQPAPTAPVANTVALPAGSAPASALIVNAGPDVAWVALAAAAATTTGTAAAGSTSLVVASATSVALGQAVIGVGVAEGTYVKAISGTTITLSQPTTAALSTTAVVFVNQVTFNTGSMMIPNGPPLSLAYGSNAYISAITNNTNGRSLINVTVGV